MEKKEENKKSDITQKLQELVKKRKNQKIVIKQGSGQRTSRKTSGSSSGESYSYSDDT